MPVSKLKYSTDNILALLKENDLRVTKARVSLLEILFAEHGPFTAEELRLKMSQRKDSKGCDLVTVYRCIEKFESADIVDSCDFGDGTTRYEIRSDKHHHHVICRQCSRVEPIDICPIDNGSIKFKKIKFKKITHRLEFFGVCQDCFK